MKKSFLCLLIITSIVFAGCKNSSEEFLAYQVTDPSSSWSVDNRITQGDFFAKDLAVVSEEDNHGDDENLTSGATLLIDTTDNEVKYADQVYHKMYPASLTKLLTALVVLKYGELTDMVTIGSNAPQIANSGAKVIGFHEGDVISLESLLNCLLIYSGNDAAIAIADHVSSNEEAFVQLMNEEANKIGAIHSNFVNSHGLHDDNQYTTAYDMYLIMNELLSYDTFRNIISKSDYTAVYKDAAGVEHEKILKTTNEYLNGTAEITSGFQVVGGISGSTNKAGKCMILICNEISEKEYISLILNAPDNNALYSQMNHLLTYVNAE